MNNYKRHGEVLFSDVGDDLVALDVARGLCFGMNDVSAFVWKLIESPRSVDDICTRLLEEYDVAPAQCHSEVSDFLELLVREGLATKEAVAGDNANLGNATQ